MVPLSQGAGLLRRRRFRPLPGGTATPRPHHPETPPIGPRSATAGRRRRPPGAIGREGEGRGRGGEGRDMRAGGGRHAALALPA